MQRRLLVDDVDPLIGSDGPDPTEYGGTVPCTAPPFAMTRWTPMTRENRISACAYHARDERLIGFVGSRQPAIWMGDLGQVVFMPGVGEARPRAADRALPILRATERSTVAEYAVDLATDAGPIGARLTGTSRVGVLALTFPDDATPHVVVQATRAGFVGGIEINPARREVSGWNPERQDSHLGPPQAASFRGWFVARFDAPLDSWATAHADRLDGSAVSGEGEELAAVVRFAAGTRAVGVRIGTSLVSAEQARRNLDAEVPDGVPFDDVVAGLREAWSARIDRFRVQGASDDQRVALATALFHVFQFPSRIDEGGVVYDGHLDRVVPAPRPRYTAFSLWDTFRAQHALLVLLAPEETADMDASLLRTYVSSGRLPIWENLVETNIMVGTHAASLLAESVVKGLPLDVALAAEAALKDAEVPPDEDLEHRWADRGPERLLSARPGLTRYLEQGWVAQDETAEAGSRTLDYAYDDRATAVLLEAAGRAADAERVRARTGHWQHLWNPATGFLQTRDRAGAFVDGGWTEGTRWPYLFQVLHDIEGLRALMGPELLLARLDEHFADGWNRHDNEPSHHIPYLHSLAGRPWRSAEETQRIAESAYTAARDGLCGNDDLGQMSAWFVFTLLGFYPVDPVSGEYVVAAPLVPRVEIDLPGEGAPLVVEADGREGGGYVAALEVDGVARDEPRIAHADLRPGATLRFTMAAEPTRWGARD